jgi:hypothetical protein
VIKENGKRLEDLEFIGTRGRPAVLAIGASGIVIRRCRFRHGAGSAGIELRNCAGASIEDCTFEVTDAPPTGPLAAETNAVVFSSSPDGLVRRVLVRDCSTGILGLRSPHLRVAHLTGINQRGPFPRGALVQFARCEKSQLENFYARNDINVAHTEDNVSVWRSDGCTIRRGLIAGNNSPSGMGVMFEHSNEGLCEDVDVSRFSNGAFAAYPGRDIIFRRCRARDSYRPTPRGEPKSNSVVFAASPEAERVRVIDCSYFAHVNPKNVVWERSRFSTLELALRDFPPAAPQHQTHLPRVPWLRDQLRE